MLSILRIAVFAYPDERIHRLGNLVGELRPGDWPTGLLPVNRVDLQAKLLDLSGLFKTVHIRDGSSPCIQATVGGG